jgi:nucleoside-diphosphate-sugar epimerase
MKKRKILIADALGAVGRCALEHFEKLSDWDIIGAARRKPDFETRAEWIQVDLRDAADCKAKLAGVNDLTSIAYMAVYEKADVTRGWSEIDHVQINLRMLTNMVEYVERASPNLHHVTLLQGTKARVVHQRRREEPSRSPSAAIRARRLNAAADRLPAAAALRRYSIAAMQSILH